MPSPKRAEDPRVAVFRAAWETWMKDSEAFLFGIPGKINGAVITQDEHDASNPLKPLPDRPHLRVLAKLCEEQQLAVGKSRQMMVSWFFMARILWEVMHPGRRWLVTCRKFEDANGLLDRMWGIYERLPVPTGIKPKAVRKEGVITVKHAGVESQVMAAAQDTDAPRSKTFSGIFIDEGAFTDYLAKLIAAAKPTVMSGGNLWLVSSPNGRDFFHNLLSDAGRLDI